MKLIFRTLLIALALVLGVFARLTPEQAQAQTLEVISNYNNSSPCSNGSCPVESGQHAFNFWCDGRVPDCRSNEAIGSVAQTLECGRSVQVDVFNTNCRPNGVGQEPWACADPSTIVTYMTWYTGDCAAPGPSCKEIAGLTGDTAAPDQATTARVPKLGESMFLRCRKVANASNYRFRMFYSRKKRPDVYQTIANLTPVNIKRFEQTNRSANFAITQVGFYYGQCRVCQPDASKNSGETCGAWESASNVGIRWSDDEGAVSNSFNSTAAADDGLPPGVAPKTRAGGQTLSIDSEVAEGVGSDTGTVQLVFPEVDE